MRTPFFFGSCAIAVASIAASLAFGSFTASCGAPLPGGTGGSSGTGGSGGSPAVPPGETCTDPTPDLLRVRVSPSKIFLPPCPAGATSCITRQVTVIVDPDTCTKSALHFESSDAKIAQAPADASVELHRAEVPVTIQAGPVAGSTTITVHAVIQGAKGKIGEVTAALDVEVIDTDPPCMGPASTPKLKGGDTLTAGGASIGLPVGGDNPDQGSFLWGVTPFPATLACAADIAPTGFQALGPAIVFGPTSSAFQREVPLSVPINPALMPSAARQRHLRVAYSGPGFKQPRVVPVADARIAKVGGQWALTFKAPRLGTYQAVVAPDAGTKIRKRRMTHRAVMGISMGGGGTATFGFRHHNLFDVLAPLGGPVDWTWMLDYIANNHLGGFRPIAKGTALKDIQLTATTCMTSADCKSDETCLGVIATPPTPGKCVLLPKVTDPYAHPQTFNTWWYEYPRGGNGGSFDRQSYGQIFRDLALMYGNPNSDNLAPGGENLPAGVPPTDPSVVGDHPGNQCAVTLDPICPTGPDGMAPATCPELAVQQALAATCPVERCKHTLTLQNYFDDEYNPDGTFPVITVCDGSSQNQALTPYSNTWHSDGNGYPLEVGLAVDYNGNGVRDELEPIIRSGHEPWRDDGVDGIPSSKEPGYSPGVNDDPAGDDYNPQYNPAGTEGDHRWQQGEHYDDFGLDGVAGTPQQPPGGWQKPGDGYDVGEGDGQFTVSRGLQRFWDRDAHAIVRRALDPAKVPGGDMDDTALARVDMWTDGGLRDLFNFSVAAQHLTGAFAARGRTVGYLTATTQAPGLDPTVANSYDPKLVDFADLPGVVMQRYGHIDPSAVDVEDGSGQHVGTGTEITSRLQSALYFIGSRWRDRPELLLQVEDSTANPQPGAPECEVTGTCTINFVSKGGRNGPVGISLPPGYAHAKLQYIRYPVIYLLHGYGQSPQDLEAAIVLLQNWMNSALNSSASRLAKAIIVYVDGRCRVNADGSPECLRGTFFADSVRKNGAQDETWWLELMQYMDQHYRTLGETNVDWIE